MKCVVIGGGGFIGSHLSEKLIDTGHDLIVFDRPSAANLLLLARKGAKIITDSFLDPFDLDVALNSVDVVFHLVSTTVPKTSNENPEFDVESNLIGTIKLLNASKLAGIKKVIFASSGGTVYGIPKEIPINESHQTDPISSYGIVKLAIEKYLHLYWTLFGLDYCILRLSNAYGPRQAIRDAQGLIPKLIYDGIHNVETVIWGDGTVVRDYVYISDIVEAFSKAILYDRAPKLFNIGSGTGRSVREIIELIEKNLGSPLIIRYENSRVYDVQVNTLSEDNASKLLLWKPITSITEGISHTIDYIRSI